MKPLKSNKRMNPKGHTSMSRPHPNRNNKLRLDKKASRSEAVQDIVKQVMEDNKEVLEKIDE